MTSKEESEHTPVDAMYDTVTRANTIMRWVGFGACVVSSVLLVAGIALLVWGMRLEGNDVFKDAGIFVSVIMCGLSGLPFAISDSITRRMCRQILGKRKTLS